MKNIVKHVLIYTLKIIIEKNENIRKYSKLSFALINEIQII